MVDSTQAMRDIPILRTQHRIRGVPLPASKHTQLRPALWPITCPHLAQTAARGTSRGKRQFVNPDLVFGRQSAATGDTMETDSRQFGTGPPCDFTRVKMTPGQLGRLSPGAMVRNWN